MDFRLRSKFNADFALEKYVALLRCVNESEKWPADFRLSDTPIFLTSEFRDEVVRAANEIVAQTRTPGLSQHARNASPTEPEVPKEPSHPDYQVVALSLCAEGTRLVAQL